MKAAASAGLILLLMLSASSAPVVFANPGSQNPVAAAPPVSRPTTASCTVTLLDNQPFGPTGGPRGFTPFLGTFSPPSGCPPPWSKVVLDATFTVAAGRQFDRIGMIWLGGVEIFRTSTAEPSHTFGPVWQVAKDVSEYSSLFADPQSVAAVVSNIVTSVFTSTVYETATLTFYETSLQFPPAPHPDAVLPLSRMPTPTTAPFFQLTSPSARAASAFTLPAHLARLSLEIYATPHSRDEAWYSNQPTPYAVANGLFGGTAFREIQVSVDGELAGVVWPFPLIYTGGWNPYLWRPISAVNALDIPGYVVDLTPFAGILSDGNQHTIALSVFNDYSYWLVDANLLLFEDAGLHGGLLLTHDVASTPSETVDENVNNQGALFTTTASRSVAISGEVEGAAGPIVTSIEQTLNFTNRQVLNLLNGRENLNGNERITTVTRVEYPDKTVTISTSDTYPLAITSAFIVPVNVTQNVEFILPATVDQSLSRGTAVLVNGVTQFTSAFSDAVHAKAVYKVGSELVTNGQTTERYFNEDSTAACFDHFLAAAQGTVVADTLRTSC